MPSEIGPFGQVFAVSSLIVACATPIILGILGIWSGLDRYFTGNRPWVGGVVAGTILLIAGLGFTLTFLGF